MLQQTNVSQATLDPFLAREIAFDRLNERTIRDQGIDQTVKGQAIVKKYLGQAVEAVKSHLEIDTHRIQTMKDFLLLAKHLEPELVALVGMNIGLKMSASEPGMTRTLQALGKGLEDEAWAHKLYDHDAKLARRLETLVRKRNSSAKSRKAAIRSMAQKQGFGMPRWSQEERQVAGQWLLEVILKTDAFVRVEEATERSKGKPESFLKLTEEALAHSEAFVEHLLDHYPAHQPMLTKPAPWKGTMKELSFEGRKYPVYMVRKEGCKVTQDHLTKAHRAGQLQPVYDALNAMEATAWAINEPVLDLVDYCYRYGIPVEGIPPKTDVDPPKRTKEWEDMDEDERKAWKIAAAQIAEGNRSFIGQRRTLERDIGTAELLASKGNRFWTPANLDYRGRVYYLPHFNFQRGDVIRSMFLFANGEPIGKDGLHWLKVHLASTGDFGKVSKKPFEDRVAWVDENLEMIERVAKAPRDTVEWWSKADKPFMFVAACLELSAALKQGDSYVCRLPVSFDGSCSGLQHLAAMTLCEVTAPLVNVSPTENPSDIYQTVWEKVLPKFQWDARNSPDPETRVMGQKVVDHNGGRSLVKRNVMVYSYGSRKFGMADQHQEDLMRPLKLKVMSKEIAEHPFAMPDEKYVGQKVSKYLASHIFNAIEETVTKPAEAMKWLQQIARALAHEGRPVVWTTPLGFPVVLRCPEMTTKAVRMFLMDKGVTVEKRPIMHVEDPKGGIDKNKASNTIAPSFVHSYDACHLMMVVNESRKRGIATALVHDSFGCLPNRANEFRDIITSQFHWLYAFHDVLGAMREEALQQIQTNSHRIPEPFYKGGLDIAEVLNATYAFA
jgi:DNA-directed RNA polymerase